MNIFFSYPHDANASLVMRIKADLEARGHEIWLDSSEIKEGDEWRNKITRGILGSQAVVAFLSKHSVRDPGVCLNEIGIALAEKSDDALVTVLVEPEKDVSAPISITHIQWLSMEDWQEFANDGGWYKTQLNKLIEIIENPSSVSRNHELETLREVLDPLSFNADIAQHLRDFTGRRWLFERYTNWLSGDATSRVFRLEGGPGLGKTAFASQLAHASKSSVLAIFLCQSSRSESRSPLRLIQTLAYQLATRLPDYRARLLKVPAITNPELMKDKSEADLWANLISEPLSGVGKGLIDRQRMVIVIDGLDEASENGYNAIVKLLAENIRSLPSWIGFVLTGRADPEVVQRLSAFKPDVINGEDPQNLDDINEYIDGWMQAECKAGHLTQEQVISAKAALINKSEGAFLYIIKAREAVADGTLSLTRPGELPQGLNEIYLRFFERRFSDAANENGIWVRYVKPLLAYILVSPEPLPLDLARKLLGWDIAEDGDEQEAKTLVSLGSLVNQRPAEYGVTLNLFHKSVREWLQHGELAGLYFVGTRNALIYLTKVVWKRYSEFKDKDKDIYDWLVLPNLLPILSQKEPRAMEQLLGSLESDKYTRDILFQLANSLPPKLRFNEALAMFQIVVAYCQRLLEVTPENAEYARDLSISSGKLGSLLETLGKTQAAIGYHQKSLDICKRMADNDPDNYDYAHSLSVSFDNLGNVQYSLGNKQIAIACYKDSLDIRKRLAENDPDNTNFAHSLSVSLIKLGDLQDMDPIAVSYYQDSLEIVQRLADNDPDNTDYAHTLMVILNNFAGLQKRLGNLQSALGYYKRSLDFSQRLFDAHPENTIYTFYLGRSFSNLGDLEKDLGDTQSALNFNLRGFEILHRLTDAAPENTEFARCLGVNLGNLGDLHNGLGQTQTALDCYQRRIEIDQFLVERDPENARDAIFLAEDFESLAKLYDKLGQAQAGLNCFMRSIEIFQRLSDAVPENTSFLNELKTRVLLLGIRHEKLGQIEAALDCYLQTIEIIKYLVDTFPKNADHLQALSAIFGHLGDIYHNLGQTQTSLDYYQHKIEIDQLLKS